MTNLPNSADEDFEQFGSTEIRLSKKDWEFFIEQLENPPEPTPALIALMRGEEYIDPNIKPHKYEAEEHSGIGFCKICFNDNMDNPIHIKE